MGRGVSWLVGLTLLGLTGCGGSAGGAGGGGRSLVGTWRFVAARLLVTNETITFDQMASDLLAGCGTTLTAFNFTFGADGSFELAIVVDGRTLSPSRGTYRTEGHRLIAAITTPGDTRVGCDNASVDVVGAGGFNAELTWVDDDSFLLTAGLEVDTFARWQVYPSGISAEARVISGRVTNALTGLPLAGVTVSSSGRSTTTGPDGTYRLTQLPRTGAVTLTFAASGFSTRTVTVTDPAQTTVDVNWPPAGGSVDAGTQPPTPPDLDALPH